MFDLSSLQHRELWLSHPVVGELSFDSFVRSPANPILIGSKPYEWPVNGFSFTDPPTGGLCLYVRV
jgi:hypothetical protein